MEKDRNNQKTTASSDSEEESPKYEAPEITKHEMLRGITATPTPDYGPSQ